MTVPAPSLRVAGAQIANVVGDADGNADRILDAMRWAEAQDADVVVFPELALTGYPLADLVTRADFTARASERLGMLAARSGSTAAVVGTVTRVPPRRSWDTVERSHAIGAAVLCDGELRGTYNKVLLPNYEIFDEARNFAPGDRPDMVWRIGEALAGIAICEDLWSGDGPPERQAAAGAQILLVPNASPFHQEKPRGRLDLAARVARRNGVPVVYVNCVGGQDELVFDGGSIVVGADGELLHRSPQFAEDRFVLDVPLAPARPGTAGAQVTTVHARPQPRRPPLERVPVASTAPDLEQVWQALVCGTRDFVRRNGASGVALGLSGGIDAAVTAMVAVDALGPQNVLGIAMPAPHSPPEDLVDARALAQASGIRFAEIPIHAPTAVIGDEVAGAIGTPLNEHATTALHARTRAAIVWAVCDQLGYLPLATGNKTELSIGSASLHGDMAGAFAPLKDCRKTLLHRLAELRNERGHPFPARTLELAPAVGDDAGPPYDVLDAVVERYIEKSESEAALIADGFDPEIVRGILQLADDAELERRQTPPGVRITQRAFGQDLRMPITNAWRPFAEEVAEVATDAPMLAGSS